MLAIIGTSAMLVLSMAFMKVSLQADRGGRDVVDRIQTLYLAEAGLAEAVTSMKVNSSGNIGTVAAPVRFGDGLLWASATETDDDEYRIDVTAMTGAGRVAISSMAQRGSSGGIGQGLFTTQRLELKKEFFSDSYDSDLGTYASQAKNTYTGPAGTYTYAHAKGHVATNDRVRINEKTVIFGDVSYGEGGEFQDKGKGKSHVSGSIKKMPPLDLPAVKIPAAPPTLGDAHLHGNVKSGYDLVLGPGVIHYDEFKMHNDAKVKIVGPATFVVTKKLTVESPLTIDDTNGPVQVYAKDKVEIKKAAVITTTSGKTDGLYLMVGMKTDKKGKLKKHKLKIEGTFHGVLYAPYAHIEFKESTQFYGAILALSAKVEKGHLHYDERLARINALAGGPSAITITSWRMVPLANASYTRAGRDPFQVLHVKKSDLLTPAQAWTGQLPTPTQTAGLPWAEDDFPWLDPDSLTWPAEPSY